MKQFFLLKKKQINLITIVKEKHIRMNNMQTWLKLILKLRPMYALSIWDTI